MNGLSVAITSLKDDPSYAKCPRCWRYTGEGRFNFDGLCDRCCAVILADYPEHPSVLHIQAAYARQREDQGWQK